MEALMVGYAQACVTPPVGIRMLGYAVRLALVGDG